MNYFDIEIRSKSVYLLWYVEYIHIYRYMCVSNVVYSFVRKRKRGRSRKKKEIREMWMWRRRRWSRERFGYEFRGIRSERVRNERLMVWWNIKGVESVDRSIARGLLHVPICVCHPPGLLARFFLHSLYYYF